MLDGKYAKGKKVQLAANFDSAEFDCHGSDCCAETLVDQKLVEYLQKIRDHFKKPVNISSGYRCVTHNSKPSTGGATGSRHTKGQAADIFINGVAPAEIAKYAESIGVLGIGLYETDKDGWFVHVDVRDYKSFWYGQAQAKRVTFGGKDYLQRGSKGAKVVELQNQLVKLGYDLAPYGADGDFGKKTEDAVKAFQKKNNVFESGIVEEQTQKALENALKPQTLRKGDKNDKVKELQTKLLRLGFDCVWLDGDFGAKTEEAVKAFQHERGIEEDGICGKNTWAEIERFAPYTAKVTAILLNVRTGPGTKHSVKTTVKNSSKHVIVYEKDGWGKLEKGAGWVSLKYMQKI